MSTVCQRVGNSATATKKCARAANRTRSRNVKKRPDAHIDKPLDFSAPKHLHSTSIGSSLRAVRSCSQHGQSTAPSFLASPTSMASSRNSCTPPQTEPLDLSSTRRGCSRGGARTPPMMLSSAAAFSPLKPASVQSQLPAGLLLDPSSLAAIQSLLALSASWQPPTPASVSSLPPAALLGAGALQPVRLPAANNNQPSTSAQEESAPPAKRFKKDKTDAAYSQLDGGDAETSENGAFVINPATGNKVRRNYKNMTKERRQEANARERSRVHTIGAAFERLRDSVPAAPNVTLEHIMVGDGWTDSVNGGDGGSANNGDLKLSKLAVLRIACKYILLLAAMNGKDYSAEKHGYSVDDCLHMLNETVANECKAMPQIISPAKPTQTRVKVEAS